MKLSYEELSVLGWTLADKIIATENVAKSERSPSMAYELEKVYQIREKVVADMKEILVERERGA